MKKALVVGVGNLSVRGDDLGLRVIEAMEKMDLPNDVEIAKAPRDPAEVLDRVSEVENVIIIDAFKSPDEPGKVYVMNLKELEKLSEKIKPVSSHQTSVIDVAKIAETIYGKKLRKIIFIGANVTDQMSEKEIKKLVPKVIKQVCIQINKMRRTNPQKS